ncbi:secretory carrier-associated membrane protein 2-like [Watersipora subatra]|uniref:secretory carrier-associated membrane protein 2-like n=1 Tax=Watersipora subatra TaxID=2589382 RepID=UPI00355C159C
MGIYGEVNKEAGLCESLQEVCYFLLVLFTMTEPTSNPFADPYERTFQGDANPPAAKMTSLDDYDPFGGRSQTTVPSPQSPQTMAPPQPNIAPPQTSMDNAANIQRSLSDPPPYQPAAAQQVDTSELQRRQEELERKAAELEQELQKKNETNATQKNNCPPLPPGCCIQPCFHQDFETDIPPEYRRVAKTVYFSYILRAVVLTLNFLFCIGYLAMAHYGLVAAERSLGLSIFHLLWWILVGFLCWQRPNYNAFRRDSALSYFWFLFITAWNILVDIFMVLGPAGTGYLGILTAATYLNDRYDGQSVRNMGGVTFIIVIGSLVLLSLDIYLLIMVHRFYRRAGVTVQQAQTEFSSGVWRNQHVQAAGAQAVSAVGTQAVSAAASGAMAGGVSNTGSVQ